MVAIIYISDVLQKDVKEEKMLKSKNQVIG
jgi:hypothetical protein